MALKDISMKVLFTYKFTFCFLSAAISYTFHLIFYTVPLIYNFSLVTHLAFFFSSFWRRQTIDCRWSSKLVPNVAGSCPTADLEFTIIYRFRFRYFAMVVLGLHYVKLHKLYAVLITITFLYCVPNLLFCHVMSR